MLGLDPQIVAWVGAAGVALGLVLLGWGVFGTRSPRKTVLANLSEPSSQATDLRPLVLERSATERAVQPSLRWIAARGRRLTPAGVLDKLDRRLTLAGRPAAWPIERVLAAKVLATLGAALLGLVAWLAEPTPGRAAFALAFVGLVYLAPDLLLSRAADQRQQAIQQALPDTLDQLSICVAAGLGFEAAMSRVGYDGRGPMAEELVRTLQEMRVGVGRGEALQGLADRNDVGDLRSFVLAVRQAEQHGIPITRVLSGQAKELRTRRRQTAEERAMKGPVKIVFPLVFCILPALFVVILGPAVINISQTLFGEGGAL